MKVKIGTGEIELQQGDITKISVDAIVNAANEGLRGGGPRIMEECRRIGRCPTGQAVVTTAGGLPARYVIHAVGPIWRGGDKRERDLLANAYRQSLGRAEEKRLTSVAFPSISTGAYGYPIEEACEVALSTAMDYLRGGGRLRRIVFALFSEADLRAYQETLRRLAAGGKGDVPKPLSL